MPDFEQLSAGTSVRPSTVSPLVRLSCTPPQPLVPPGFLLTGFLVYSSFKSSPIGCSQSHVGPGEAFDE